MTILLGPVPAMDTMDVRAEEARTAEREAAENFLVVALPLVNWVFTAGAAEAERAKDIGVVVVAGVVGGCAKRTRQRMASRGRLTNPKHSVLNIRQSGEGTLVLPWLT